MGPYAVSDLAGLDIGWANRKRLAPDRDPRERVPAYADKLCEAGHFGRKTGTGHYVYDEGGKSPNTDVLQLLDSEREALGIEAQSFDESEIISRCMAAMVNESCNILEEGIARRPLDIDVVLLMGYGFPRFHGGPMKWADLQGLPGLLANIEKYALQDSFFWQRSALLQKLAESNESFESLNNTN